MHSIMVDLQTLDSFDKHLIDKQKRKEKRINQIKRQAEINETMQHSLIERSKEDVKTK